MRAPDYISKPRSIYPDLHSSWNPFGKSIYDEPSHAAERIHSPGYRYLPMHREIYGYSPRQLYPHQYKPVERFVPARPFDADKAWNDHLNRLGDIDKMYPIHSPLSRYTPRPITSKPLYDIHGNILDDILPRIPTSMLSNVRPLLDLLNPSPYKPISSFTRDPWWYPSYAPYIPHYAQRREPFFLRDSYLSPIKRRYLWSRHPLRPFARYY